MPFPRTACAVVLTVATVAVAIATGCRTGSNASSRSEPIPALTVYPDRRVVSEGYVGAKACQPCHPTEHGAHGKSRHARSLHVLEGGIDPALAPPVGPMDGSDGEIVRSGSRWALAVAGEGDPLPLDLAFGSGKAGVTYAALLGDEMLEVHRTWFGPKQRWYSTPGHERMPAENIGMMYRTEQAKTCLLCHSTALPDNGLLPSKAFRGVGCESCHGPGQAHVSAMASNPSGALSIRKLKGAAPSVVNGVCGQCHRSRESASSENSEIGQTNRFQMVGMLKSACYIKTKGAMTCVTCHAPHTDAPSEPSSYETACKSCHTPQTKPCPVDKDRGCVRCHMPERPTFTSGGLPTQMADHWIQRRPQTPASSD